MFACNDEAALGIVVEIGVVFGDEGMTAALIDLLVQRAPLLEAAVKSVIRYALLVILVLYVIYLILGFLGL